MLTTRNFGENVGEELSEKTRGRPCGYTAPMTEERNSWENEYPDELEREGRMRPTLARAVRDHEAAGNAADETVAEAVWADGGGEAAALDSVDDGGRAKSSRPRETQQQKLARIKRELEAVPTEPGVYLWKDAGGEVIYVGKAKQLRARMRQYVNFQDDRAKIPLLVEAIDSFDYLVVDNEHEALVLEKNLINQYSPFFNADFKDNKSYPFIALTKGDVFPAIKYTREKHRPDTKYFGPFTDARAARYKALREERKLIDLGAADEACLDAMSIMEFSNAHGTIVCMPTGGASGIVPAAVYRIGERLGKTETEQENALLVAGLIGAFYYPTHYTGAIGCQAEIGVAVSMASAALCSMMTDDPDTIHCAASLGGQVLMGLLCNPIEGYVQVPCIVRNMAAVPTAVTCANAALAGMDHIVPLDDVVALMLAVGEKIRPCDEAGTYILKKEEE